ncbi:hypothetical protein LOC54_00740 [Acetobacter sp. AN02]|uniref:hypothetical protein n=1 Tax=Acetobacter sp. AN02 TaxID=2894186 RepID=UPI0024345FC9|nr:hypothetical protein [Acetobacter sp. AN02]MDG6093652.1 hypothetical protein [Acetobacter sp. AN02]
MSADKIKKDVKNKAEGAVSSAKDDFEALRSQFEKFLSTHVATGLDDAAAKATEAVANAREVADTQAKNVSTKVVKKPLLSIALSAVIGFVAGRLTR